MYGLDGRVAVVSGAATGIGRAIAIRLAAEGASVEIIDLQDSSSTCDEIRSIPSRCARRYSRTDVRERCCCAAGAGYPGPREPGRHRR